MRKRSGKRIAGLVIAVIIAGLIAASLWYVSDYYQADEEMVRYYLAQSNPSVTSFDHGLFLDGEGTETALIFYPGGKVEYTAYLPLLNRLAASGVDCFLVRMPANLAFLDMNRAKNIMASYSYDHWYLAGHSLGGVAAAFSAARSESPADGLILLAAYPVKALPDMDVLELYGSRDTVLNRERLAKGDSYLPPNAVVMEIPGGNHAQFGNYGIQEGDGEAEISAQVQQEVTAEMILKMTEK